jgi:hypothetical protein
MAVIELRVEREEVVPAAVTGAAPYLTLVGTYRGAVDPADRRNAVIADVDLAPRQDGRVVYESSFYILRPLDWAAGNGKVFYDFLNRGNKRILGWLNDAVESNDPTAPEHFGHGWLMRQGYTVAWSAWQGDIAPGAGRMTIRVPVATQPDGSPIVGPVVAERVPTSPTDSRLPLPYPTAREDATNGRLTVRERSGDRRAPLAGWAWDGPRRIRLPEPVRPWHLYEFVYEARDPLVLGLGHAATRDFVSLLKYGAASSVGPALLPERPRYVYAWGRSLGGRIQSDFLYWGFNEDEAGRQVFDAMMLYATGAGRVWFNVRFGQPSVSCHGHSRRYAPEHEFPHRHDVSTDPVTGRTDGLLARALATNTCPRIIHTNSAYEYWVKGASLLHTDAHGRDVDVDAVSPNVRIYAFASLEHQTPFDAVPRAVPYAQQLTNPLYNGPAFRALAVAMDRWVSEGVPPPPSRVPRRADGTLVAPEAVVYPALPSTRYGELPPRPPLHLNPLTAKPIALLDCREAPPRVVAAAAYWRGVSQVDADGNEIGGLRLPDLMAPIGTYGGWNPMPPGQGYPDNADMLGHFVPFAATRAERLAAGDPRPALEERYGTQAGYVAAVEAAARALEAEGLLLAEDRERIVAAARARRVLPE